MANDIVIKAEKKQAHSEQRFNYPQPWALSPALTKYQLMLKIIMDIVFGD